MTGTYIDPAAARLTIGIWAWRWLEAQTHLKPSTHERYAGVLRAHIEPRCGTTRLSDATTRKVHRVLSLILAAAVEDDRLVRNPAAGMSLPRVNAKQRMNLSHEEVHELADACGGPYRLVVLFLAYTGVKRIEQTDLAFPGRHVARRVVSLGTRRARGAELSTRSTSWLET